MYRFRLEKVLRHRKRIEDLHRVELSARNSELEKAGRMLEQVEQHRSNVRLKLEDKLIHRVTIADLITYQTYLNRLTEDLGTKKEMVATAQDKVDETRARLIDAVKNRKILDTLKEKRADADRQASKKAELDFLNEVAGNRYARGRQPIE